MKLSIIIPTLNEEACLEDTLKHISTADGVEVIVVDGGSTDKTVAIAQRGADRVISAWQGRANQMNVGARAARGDVLLFLHADTLLPPHFQQEIYQVLSRPQVIGGRFDVRFDDQEAWLLRVTAFLINLRSRWTKIATGDQAIFIRHEAFFRLKEYPLIPLCEDIALSKKMKRAGQIACLRSQVITSSRRWHKQGILRTILLMWLLRFLYFWGISPHFLAKLYKDVR